MISLFPKSSINWFLLSASIGDFEIRLWQPRGVEPGSGEKELVQEVEVEKGQGGSRSGVHLPRVPHGWSPARSVQATTSCPIP